MDIGYQGLAAPCPECGDESGYCEHTWGAFLSRLPGGVHTVGNCQPCQTGSHASDGTSCLCCGKED